MLQMWFVLWQSDISFKFEIVLALKLRGEGLIKHRRVGGVDKN